MSLSFKEFLLDEKKTVYFTFGRVNPPTIGHEKVFNKLSEAAGKNPYRIFLSTGTDSKKNPLIYESKIKHTRKMFPNHARSIIMNSNIKNILEAASVLYNEGFTNATVVVGEDRKLEFDILLNKYNGVKESHGFYKFKHINVISAGSRDPDSELVEGVSSSKLRESAANNDFVTFSQGIPRVYSNKETRKLFNEVRSGLGLTEVRSFKANINLDSVSDTREKYVDGELFNVGDDVVIKENDEIGKVAYLGANYIIVEMSNGVKKRKWIDSIEKLS